MLEKPSSWTGGDYEEAIGVFRHPSPPSDPKGERMGGDHAKAWRPIRPQPGLPRPVLDDKRHRTGVPGHGGSGA